MANSDWSVYLLYSRDAGRSYIGSTTSVERRLRQHNGEIRGGARSTRGSRWFIVAHVSGFRTRSSACRWERILKCRARGLGRRLLDMTRLVEGICPKGRRDYPVPEGLSIHLHKIDRES